MLRMFGGVFGGGVLGRFAIPVRQQIRGLSSTVLAEGAWAAVLPNRGVMEVSGRDAANFLQGMTTNDVTSIAEHGNSQYAMVLTGKGRCVADIFIYKHNNNREISNTNNINSDSSSVALGDTFLIDCDAEAMPTLLKYLMRFKLRSHVSLLDVSNEYACVASKDVLLPSNTVVGGQDPRLHHTEYNPCLYRGLVRKGGDGNSELSDPGLYEHFRLKLGLSEGVRDHSNALPLQCNLDALNGVSWNKGCYVGQELTARTHHQGVVRKRVLPLEIISENQPLPTDTIISPGLEIRNSNGDKVGKTLSHARASKYLIGVVNVKKAVEDTLTIHPNSNSEDKLSLKASIPTWLSKFLET